MLNSFNAVGRTTKDIAVRTIKGADGKDTSTASFTLAVDRRMTKAQKEAAEKAKRPTADFIACTAWGKTAETLAKYAKKGQLLAVEGRIETRHYTAKDGHEVYVTECRVSDMSFIGSNKSTASASKPAEEKPAEEKPVEEAPTLTEDDTGEYSIGSDDLPF